MAIRSSLYFLFDGQNSQDFGIVSVNISSGMPEEPFMANRVINEVKIRGKDKPIFSTVTHDPLSFTLTFAFMNGFDSDALRKVTRWLSVSYFKPLQFSDNLDRVYYAMPSAESVLVHSAGQGYITLTMRCDSPYSYSPTFLSPIYDLSSNSASGTQIQLVNNGDVSIYPEIYIDKVGNGNVSITNLSNNGNVFAYTGLVNGENVFTNCETELIISDLIPTTYRYSVFNNGFLQIIYGTNNLLILGNAKIRFKYRYIYLQG